MTAVLIILAVITALVLILLLVPLRLELYYDRDGVKNELSLTIKYLCFRYNPLDKAKKETKKPKEKPKNKTEPFSFEREKQKLERYISLFEKLKSDAAKILDYAASRVVVFEKVGIDIDFGFDSAMHTGIFTGILNGFVYGVLGFVHHRSTLKEMKVNLQPVFGKICFNSHIECILRLKNVHIIIIVINVLKIIRKIKKSEGSR